MANVQTTTVTAGGECGKIVVSTTTVAEPGVPAVPDPDAMANWSKQITFVLNVSGAGTLRPCL